MSIHADKWADALRVYLGRHGFDTPRISGLARLTGGSSHDTWAFDLDYIDTGVLQKAHLILRRNLADTSLDMPPEAEFRLLNWLHEQAIPVARPWLCAIDDSPLGAPFLVCQRMPGSDLRKVLAKSRSAVDVRSTGTNLVGLQARIHSLNLKEAPLWSGALAEPARMVRDQVHRWTQTLLDASCHPLDRAAVSWLRAHVPQTDRVCLVHGDFKANNILWARDDIVTLLDWELAHVGDPVEDLAWTMLWLTNDDLVCGLFSPDEYLNAYENASGQRVDRHRLFFWQLFALVKLSAIMLTGNGTALGAKGATLGPSLAMMSRGVVYLQTAIADYLRAALDLEAASES